MEFMVGCNYWASNAGTEMWRNWDENAVREDFEILSSNGVRVLRVFTNWRDFQPVYPLMDIVGRLREYRLHETELPQNPYYLDEVMLERFERFCDLAEEYNLKLIVGILTGWMSGRLFIPPVLYEKNLYTDPTALLFEQKFIEGFVGRMKSKKAIAAWNLGNECNCMSEADNHIIAENWTAIICNAIRANDSSRDIISGMHSLSLEDKWRISEQAAYTDMLTTHPYPYFVPHCSKDRIASMRTLLHASCETKYYSDIGGKPCLVEELGTLGPMICDNETAATFLNVNLYSNWANGAAGVLWWCANEQIMLKSPPYCWNMCETELGLIDRNREPKATLKTVKEFVAWLEGLDFTLPKAEEDGVCLLTEGQDQWGAAYMSYMLAKQAKVNLRFAFAKDEIPDSDIYLLPSVDSLHMMPSYRFEELKERVRHGAVLYISNSEAVISDFESLTGVRVNDSMTTADEGKFILGGKELSYFRNRKFFISTEGAEVISCDESGMPLITVHQYGKGRVYYANFPAESMLLNRDDAYESEQYQLYRMIFCDKIKNHMTDSDSRYIGITEHMSGDGIGYAVAVNYSDKEIKGGVWLNSGYCIEKEIKGSLERIEPFGVAVVRIRQEKSVT